MTQLLKIFTNVHSKICYTKHLATNSFKLLFGKELRFFDLILNFKNLRIKITKLASKLLRFLFLVAVSKPTITLF